jgi:hypothetical protein
MKQEREMLRVIEALPQPRHLFIIPDWVDLTLLERLLDENYLTCTHQQRDQNGTILVAMGLQLTPKGKRLILPQTGWKQLVLKGSMAGASLAVLSTLILYLG